MTKLGEGIAAIQLTKRNAFITHFIGFFPSGIGGSPVAWPRRILHRQDGQGDGRKWRWVGSVCLRRGEAVAITTRTVIYGGGFWDRFWRGERKRGEEKTMDLEGWRVGRLRNSIRIGTRMRLAV